MGAQLDRERTAPIVPLSCPSRVCAIRTCRTGEATPEEIIASTKRGLYAKSFAGGQVEISKGDFVFMVAEGYLIENGKITAPVKNATIVGNGPDAMTKVVAVGNDARLARRHYTCGKGGQHVPVGVGMPTVKIARSPSEEPLMTNDDAIARGGTRRRSCNRGGSAERRGDVFTDAALPRRGARHDDQQARTLGRLEPAPSLMVGGAPRYGRELIARSRGSSRRDRQRARPIALRYEGPLCRGSPTNSAQFLGELSLNDPAVGARDDAEKIEDVLALERAIRAADRRIVNSSGSHYGDATSAIALANSSGFRGAYTATRASRSTAPLRRGERLQAHRALRNGRALYARSRGLGCGRSRCCTPRRRDVWRAQAADDAGRRDLRTRRRRVGAR